MTLSENVTMDVTLSNLVNLDLAGYTIDGSVTISSTESGTLEISAGTITGNLEVNTPNATVNNYATVNGTITITDVASGTWNEYANNNTLIVEDKDGLVLNILGDVQGITVSETATGEIIITVDETATVTSMTINKPVTIISPNPVEAVVADTVEVRVKSNEEDLGIIITGSTETGPIDLALEAATQAVVNAENAKANFEIAIGSSSLDWDTLITAMYYLDEQATVKVSSLDSEFDTTSLQGRIDDLYTYYAGLAQLDMSSQNTSQYEISTGALVNFTGLTSLNLSSTGITELGGLTEMSDLEILDLSGNQIQTTPENDQLGAIAGLTSLRELNLAETDITAISAIAGLINLESLNVSGTNISDFNVFWNGTGARFGNLTELQATDIDSLESIAGLVEIVNSAGFSSEGITWNLGGSTLLSDNDGHVQMIANKFTSGTFTAPEVIDTIAPEISESGTKVELVDAKLVLTVVASDNVGLAELEVDHSLGKHSATPVEYQLPEFNVPAQNMTGAELATVIGGTELSGSFDDASVSFDNGTWVIDFGEDLTSIIASNISQSSQDSISFYLVVKDLAGNASGDMNGNYVTTTMNIQ